MKKFLSISCAVVMTLLSGCKKQEPASFQGHTLGESFPDFAAYEHPAIKSQEGIPYTGTVECSLSFLGAGQRCDGKFRGVGHTSSFLPPSDDASFTFVNGKLVEIKSEEAGGIIGSEQQNWNLSLAGTRKQFGEPDKLTATDALWLRHSDVVHAYLTVGKMMYVDHESQTEHIIMADRKLYEQSVK